MPLHPSSQTDAILIALCLRQNVQDIADQFGISRQRVYQIIDQAKKRGDLWPDFQPATTCQYSPSKIIEELVAGKTVKQVSTEQHCSIQRINYLIRRARQDGTLPADFLPTRERKTTTNRALGKRSQQIFDLRQSGLSIAEIMLRLGIKKGQVYKSLRTARERGVLLQQNNDAKK